MPTGFAIAVPRAAGLVLSYLAWPCKVLPLRTPGLLTWPSREIKVFINHSTEPYTVERGPAHCPTLVLPRLPCA
ncbi:MAG: hypothetical protein R2706_15775 [Acidimicrobiales bacterium]